MRQKAPVTVFETARIWASVAAADRINGGQYVNDGNICQYYATNNNGETIQTHRTNKEIFREFLYSTTEPLPEDYAAGQELRNYIRTFSLKLLSGALNEFLTSALKAAEVEEWTSVMHLPLGQVVYFPEMARKQKLRDEIEEDIAFSASKHISKVGERVTLAGKVLKCNFSQQWNTFYVTVKTAEGNLCWFAYRTELALGQQIRFTGTVKRHADEGQTQFNRVKIMED